MYYTLYTIKLKICTQRFHYSSSKFSKFIQGKSPLLQQLACVCLFAKGEVKNVSKNDRTSLMEWPARPFMFAALCQRAHPLNYLLAESIFISRGITVYMFDFKTLCHKNHIVSITEHNTVCNITYVHTNTTCPMIHSLNLKRLISLYLQSFLSSKFQSLTCCNPAALSLHFACPHALMWSDLNSMREHCIGPISVHCPEMSVTDYEPVTCNI